MILNILYNNFGINFIPANIMEYFKNIIKFIYLLFLQNSSKIKRISARNIYKLKSNLILIKFYNIIELISQDYQQIPCFTKTTTIV